MKKHNYKNTRKPIKKHRKKNKTRNNKQKGGILGAINSGEKTNKLGAYNVSYKTTMKKGWVSPKIYNIEYLVPNNFLLYKDPNSFLTPTFFVTRNGITFQNCSIMIDKKFVDYFVNINGHWYALIRIYGLINTGVLATWTNTVFYQLNNNLFDLEKNEIIIPDDVVTIVDKSELNIFQRIPQSNNAEIIKLKPEQCRGITDGELYLVLRQFRNEQLINYQVKEEITNSVAQNTFETFIDFFK